jgi:hypothetical protein
VCSKVLRFLLVDIFLSYDLILDINTPELFVPDDSFLTFSYFLIFSNTKHEHMSLHHRRVTSVVPLNQLRNILSLSLSQVFIFSPVFMCSNAVSLQDVSVERDPLWFKTDMSLIFIFLELRYLVQRSCVFGSPLFPSLLIKGI